MGPGHGRPTGPVGRRPMGPTALELRRGSLPLVPNDGSRCKSYRNQSRRGWLPPINMSGGAPNHEHKLNTRKEHKELQEKQVSRCS